MADLADGGEMPEPVPVPEPLRREVESRVAANDFELPVLPQVAVEVLELCRRADADAQRISDVLHRDAGIAGNVLRVANSPLLGSRVKIQSLQQAISRLGIEPLSTIVVAISMNAKMFELPDAWRGLVSHELRSHSLLTAAFAKEIARIGRTNVESAFLQGLLHSMGKPVLMALAQGVEQSQGVTFTFTEICALLDSYHADVGGRLCDAWQLAGSIGVAIRHQHDWASCPDNPDSAALVDLAQLLADLVLGQGVLESAETYPARAHLNIYPDELESLWARRDELVRFAEAV